MSLEEAILDKVRRLPPAKREEVLRFADGLQDSARARIVPSRDRTVEMKWIDLNRAAYADQWVAVEGDRLVAAGNDPLKVCSLSTRDHHSDAWHRVFSGRLLCPGLHIQ